MHLLLPLPIGDEDFCVGDASTMYKANGGMPLPFCISLLDSVEQVSYFYCALELGPACQSLKHDFQHVRIVYVSMLQYCLFSSKAEKNNISNL